MHNLRVLKLYQVVYKAKKLSLITEKYVIFITFKVVVQFINLLCLLTTLIYADSRVALVM